MSLFSKILGVMGATFQINAADDGPLLKDENGAIAARTNDDSAYAIMRGATPVAANDLATKNFAESVIGGGVAAFPSEMVDFSNQQVITTSQETILFDNAESLIDESGAEYTVNPATGEVTFDTADGVKLYEVHGIFNIDPIDNSGSTRTRVVIRAKVDGVHLQKARCAAYLREATNDDETGTSTSTSFIVQPTVGQILTFTIAKNETTTCRLENRNVAIKRIT